MLIASSIRSRFLLQLRSQQHSVHTLTLQFHYMILTISSYVHLGPKRHFPFRFSNKIFVSLCTAFECNNCRPFRLYQRKAQWDLLITKTWHVLSQHNKLIIIKYFLQTKHRSLSLSSYDERRKWFINLSSAVEKEMKSEQLIFTC
jgi:hypothetical protein